MSGTIRLNIGIGILGMLLTFAFSFSNNLWSTTFLRSVYTFLILFFATFVFRWLLGTIVGLNRLSDSVSGGATPETRDHRGSSLDLSTPDDEASIREMLKGEDKETTFVPMKPEKLLRKDDLDPGQLADALRRMTDE